MIHIIADDSASIQIEQREVPLKKALMLAHLGFELKGITHRITSSSAGRIMVDNGIDSDVAKTLIAGFFAYENYDNFDERLPLYLNSLNHTAYLHVVIPVTDGKWNCGNGIIKAVAAFTQAGGIFHTVALDIHIRDTSLPGFLQEQQVSALKSADFAEKFGELLATLYFKATAGN